MPIPSKRFAEYCSEVTKSNNELTVELSLNEYNETPFTHGMIQEEFNERDDKLRWLYHD